MTVAAALAEHGFVELVIGNLNIKASSGSAQPSLSAPPPGVAPAPAPAQEVSQPPAAPEPVNPPAAPAEPSVSAAPEPRTSAPPSPPQHDEKLPALDDEAKRLLTLWTSIFPSLPDELKGRLVPFAPVEIEQGTLVLGSESEGLIDTVSELLKPVQLNHESVRSLRSQLVGSEAAPRHRAMMRQLRADRDPVFVSSWRCEHQTTQAVVDLFGAVVDEVGL